MKSDSKALLLCIGIFSGLAVYRAYSFYVTGFFVSDEFGYFWDASHNDIYSLRWFFGYSNLALFKLFHIDSPESFAYFLPGYIVFWTSVTLIAIRSCLRELKFDEKTIALSLLASMMLVSFTLLSLSFLTETSGLALAMCGIYCLLKGQKSFRWATISSLFFVAATYTREPYAIFSITGAFILALFAVRNKTSFYPFIIFGAIALISNTVIQSSLSVAPQIIDVANNMIHPPSGAQNFIDFGGFGPTGRSIPTALPGSSNVWLNTIFIFFGGLFLGWAPPVFLLSLAGFLMLTRRIRMQTTAFLLVFTALASYFVVSFIFSPDPNYLSFRNYSTIIRFSDTASPAAFLLLPFIIGAMKRFRLPIVGCCAIILLAGSPIYETYATSHLSYAGTASPLSLSYRSPAVQVRDYLSQNPSRNLTIIGIPYGWYFTAGIRGYRAYSVGPIEQIAPKINDSLFFQLHPSALYVNIPPDYSNNTKNYPGFLRCIIDGALRCDISGNQSYSFGITNEKVVVSDPTFELILVKLSYPLAWA